MKSSDIIRWAVYDSVTGKTYEHDEQVDGDSFFIDMKGVLLLGDPCWKISPAHKRYKVIFSGVKDDE